MTLVLGLTGSIGMGKTTTARIFARVGVPVFDADAKVHELYGGAAAGPVEAAFPGTVKGGRVDRQRLAEVVFGDAEALRRLEAIIHPLVRMEEARFIRACLAARARVCLLDVPLLLENRSAQRCDVIVLVSASFEIQKQRVLARPGMNPAKFEAILARQMPDAQKRRMAHAMIDTGLGIVTAEAQVEGLLKALAGCPGKAAFKKEHLDA